MIKNVFSVFLLITTALNPLVSKEPSKKPIGKNAYVTCWLESGQLGNQLFEVATTLAFAWDNKMKPIFPSLHQTKLNIPTNRDKIFFRLDASELPSPLRHKFFQLNPYVKIDIPVKRNQCLIGYFQTWKYFDHHRQKIQEILSPRPEDIENIQSKHAELLEHPFTVAVHVRTFSKQWADIIPFLGLDYYEKAMSVFPNEALFVVFSDRINWCKHHFAKIERPIIFIEQDYIDDFILMSLMKHNIIANSTFSWWAAYFNKNPDKIVVAPSHFMTPHALSTFESPDRPIPTNPNMPDWITLDIDFNAPYPEDLCDYDSRSQSIDTQ